MHNLAAKPRVVLYSHDTFGLGHSRRNWKIASGIAREMDADIILLTGSRFVNHLPMPDGVDVVTLPSLDKLSCGSYGSRSLSLGIEEILELRSKIISAVFTNFAPDIVVVDTAPKGAQGELELPLQKVKMEHGSHIVLGLRDILDEPTKLDGEWRSQNNFSFVDDIYDSIWVYGDERVYPTMDAYSFSEFAKSKADYTGYITRVGFKETSPNKKEGYDLCMLGGGQDGFALARCFVEAARETGHQSLLLPGPFMSSSDIDNLRQTILSADNVELLQGVDDASNLFKSARRVVCMAGYNTSYEVIGRGIPILFVPRTTPRKEQLIRATRLSEIGCAEMMHPDHLSSENLRDWLGKETSETLFKDDCDIDLNGLDRVPILLQRILVNRPQAVVAV